MAVRDFAYYTRELFRLYERKDYSGALEIAREADTLFTEEAVDTKFWLGCLHSLLGNREKVLGILKDAVDGGLWWSPQVLRSESDFDNIRDDPRFAEIVKQSEILFREAQSKSRPECLYFHRSGFDPGSVSPLFLTLHWKGGNAREFSRYWEQPITKNGYFLAVPQSSQAYNRGRYCWDVFELATEEILEQYRRIEREIRIDPERSIIAGTSQAARIALNLVTTESGLPIKKVLLVLPGVSEPERFLSHLKAPRISELRGYIIIGEKDRHYPAMAGIYENMRQMGLKFQMESIPGLGHNFPEEFGPYLNRALEYLQQD